MNELTDELKQKYQNYNQKKLNTCFLQACNSGNLESVKYLLTSSELKEHADIHSNNDRGFRLACGSGYLDVVQYLLTSPELKEHANIHVENDRGFRLACEDGHLDVVQYLLTSPELKEHAHVNAKDNLGFQWACQFGYVDIVQYLLSFNNQKCIHFQKTDYNLDWAMKNKYDDIILAMMQNLQINDPIEYVECLPKIKEYNSELYKQVKDLKIENITINSHESELFL